MVLGFVPHLMLDLTLEARPPEEMQKLEPLSIQKAKKTGMLPRGKHWLQCQEVEIQVHLEGPQAFQ